VKLKYLPKWIEIRRKIAKIYHEELSNLKEIVLPPPPTNGRFYDVYQHYVIRVKERDSLSSFLEARGIETMIFWPVPLHKQVALGLESYHLPMTEKVSREVLALPIYPEMTEKDQAYVIGALKEFYNKIRH